MDDLSKGYEIASLIREINSKLNHGIKNQLKETGLTMPQLIVVKVLSKNKRLKVSEISKKIKLVNSTVSGIIDRLEKQDIVRRIRSKEDRRIVYIELSNKGNDIVKKYQHTINNFFNNIFINCSEEEMETILKGLETLRKHI
ncbi:MarR family winged helix-turn-helix transcriptional regulator [Dethiothermospora halolimnae]|uniref:MarR family winged helix-turn-helix transcriptional regulator n=1 Tax=Dethiothermospora halolimnae TaxID=3114390 RepID=UPI003CCB9354